MRIARGVFRQKGVGWHGFRVGSKSLSLSRQRVRPAKALLCACSVPNGVTEGLSYPKERNGSFGAERTCCPCCTV